MTACRKVGCSQGAGPHEQHDDLLLSGGWDGPAYGTTPGIRDRLLAIHADLCRSRARWADTDAGKAVAYQSAASQVLGVIDLLTAEHPIDTATVAISTMIDGSYPDHLDPEAHRWRRCAKVSEEAGEVIEALLGVEAENPRKGRTHDLDDLRAELLDVALAAMGAWTHLNDNTAGVVNALAAHVTSRADRLASALSKPGGAL